MMSYWKRVTSQIQRNLTIFRANNYWELNFRCCRYDVIRTTNTERPNIGIGFGHLHSV